MRLRESLSLLAFIFLTGAVEAALETLGEARCSPRAFETCPDPEYDLNPRVRFSTKYDSALTRISSEDISNS